MPLLKAVALGAVAAIALPFIARGQTDMLGDALRYWTVAPVPGRFGLTFSVPVFLIVTLLGWLLLKASEDR